MTTVEPRWEISLILPCPPRLGQVLPFLGKLLWTMQGPWACLLIPFIQLHRADCHPLSFFIASLTQVGSFLFKKEEKFSLKKKILFSL